MNTQNTHWRKSLPVRIASVVASVLLLWMTICSSLLVLICASMDAYSLAKVPYDSLLDTTYYTTNTEQMISDYIRVTLNGYEDGIALYRKNFDHAETNLRFTAVNEAGEVVVSNNTQLNEQTALASRHRTVTLNTATEKYEVKQTFDTYDDIFQVNLTQYMQKAADYSHWYFTDDVVDTAYTNGFEALLVQELQVDTLKFSSVAEASSFDYKTAYGDDCTWNLAASSSSDGEDTLVTVYINRTETVSTTMKLEEYYANLEAGYHVVPADTALAQALAEGLNITIVGNATVMETYDLYLYLPHEMSVDDAFSSNIEIAERLFSYRYILLGGVFVCALLTVSAMIALCKAAGYVYDKDEPVCAWTHRIPYELLILFCGAALCLALTAVDASSYMGFSWMGMGIYIGGVVLCLCALAVFMLYTTAVRVKTRRFWSGFFTVRCVMFTYHLCCNRVLSCIALVIGAAFLFVMNVFVLRDASYLLLVLLILLIDCWALLGAAYCIYAFEVLRQYVRRMEQGDFSEPKPPIPLVGQFRRYAESLQKINEGIGVAVAKQTKAERMRTALITNVSHDLKTPLTSIVNYVDLMKREPIENTTVTEYLNVLERQSARLKKLTEDLVEASKASTGNITVDLQPTNVQVLVSQLLAEYETRFVAKQLLPVVNLPEEPLYIAADGRLIWRVFDNLLGNINKYALANTRVYLDVAKQGNAVCFTLRNISEYALNLSPDELTERFVRGDDSRNTEGSGLGLSIAKDLTRLQNGALSLKIDGDLFKAMVTMPWLEQPAEHEAGPVENLT